MTFPDAIVRRFRRHEHTRILAFGSSNTERFIPGMHWFDCLELAIRQHYGRVHTCINTGVGGDTSRMLLQRFARDAALHQPHLALVTVGGNDSFPQNGVSPEEYRANLREIHSRFTEIGTMVVFQTYYAPDAELHGDLTTFNAYMAIVREVAGETGAPLVDHLRRWEPLRLRHPEQYKPLMMDAFHLNARGNAVFGVDLAREFHADLGGNDPDFWADPLAIQALMDQLQS